jgi:ATP-dependent Clp protease ATP-binding subunit ClpC
LGPTGVGKTFLAQTLADFMFGDQDALIQVDMSEYMEKHTVSRLIGSPPGYIGHEEGGQLSEAVRRRPYCVVLFDEIEKAHPDVLHLMLQILEEGKVTDSLGRKIDFRNTIIIMTSNIGAELSNKGPKTMGFGAPAESCPKTYEMVKEVVLEEAKKTLNPEFINRLDEIVVFHSPGKEELLTIVDLEVKKLTDRLKNRNIEIVLDQSAKELLIDKGYEPMYGARPMRRAVEKYLEDPLAEELLKGTITDGDTAIAECKDKTIVFTKAVKQEEVVPQETKSKKTRKKKGE